MPYTSDSWTFGHVPTTFKRLPTVNRWGVLHGFYSDQRDDQELSNSAPDMPSGVGFRILANRNIWRFPNIPVGSLPVISYNRKDPELPFKVLSRYGDYVTTDQITSRYWQNTQVGFDLQASNPIYGASDTVRPNALMGYWMIRF